MKRPSLAALPAGGAAIREAQNLLRRQGGPAMERAVALLDQVAADMALDAEVLARTSLDAPARAAPGVAPEAGVAGDALALGVQEGLERGVGTVRGGLRRKAGRLGDRCGAPARLHGEAAT